MKGWVGKESRKGACGGQKAGTINTNTMPQGAGLHQAGGLGQHPQPLASANAQGLPGAQQALPSACHVGLQATLTLTAEVRVEALYRLQ